VLILYTEDQVDYTRDAQILAIPDHVGVTANYDLDAAAELSGKLAQKLNLGGRSSRVSSTSGMERMA